MLAMMCPLIISGKPEVAEWVVPGKRSSAQARANGRPVKKRYIGATSARMVQRLRLVGMHNYTQQALVLKYGTVGLSPHEAYTTNTCPICHVYKKGTFHGRHRVCPNDKCPTRENGILLHRELNSGINDLAAAWCQLKYLGKISANLPLRK